MSYCRFSSDDFQSDVFVYKHINGWWYTEVAEFRIVLARPLPPRLPDGTSSQERDAEVLAIVEASDEAAIDLPHAGTTTKHATPEECASYLEQLRELGYHIPQHAIDQLREPLEPLDPSLALRCQPDVMRDLAKTIVRDLAICTVSDATKRLAKLVMIGEPVVESDISVGWARCTWPLKIIWGSATVDVGTVHATYIVGWLPPWTEVDLAGNKIAPHRGGWSTSIDENSPEGHWRDVNMNPLVVLEMEGELAGRRILDSKSRSEALRRVEGSLRDDILEILDKRIDFKSPPIQEPSSLDVFELLDPPEHMGDPGEVGEEHLRIGKVGDAVLIAWAVNDDEEWFYGHDVNPSPARASELVAESVTNWLERHRKDVLEEFSNQVRALSQGHHSDFYPDDDGPQGEAT